MAFEIYKLAKLLTTIPITSTTTHSPPPPPSSPYSSTLSGKGFTGLYFGLVSHPKGPVIGTLPFMTCLFLVDQT